MAVWPSSRGDFRANNRPTEVRPHPTKPGAPFFAQSANGLVTAFFVTAVDLVLVFLSCFGWCEKIDPNGEWGWQVQTVCDDYDDYDNTLLLRPLVSIDWLSV